MSDTVRGLLYCVVFLVLEAIQAVYFGSVFQTVSSFLIGAMVFGTTSLGLGAWMLVMAPAQLPVIWQQRKSILMVNILTALGWITYFLAVQMIEPAIAFTLFSGALPLTVAIAALFNMPHAEPIKTPGELICYLLLGAVLVFLVVITMTGLSGFVRGGALVGLVGALFALFSGATTSLAVVLCRQLSEKGLGPATQFAVRFIFYAIVAALLALAGVDSKGPVPLLELAVVYVIALAILAIPIYAFQRSVPLISAQTIAVATSLGPLLVFGLQLIEARVAFAPATLAALAAYCASALLIAGSSIWSTRQRSALEHLD